MAGSLPNRIFLMLKRTITQPRKIACSQCCKEDLIEGFVDGDRSFFSAQNGGFDWSEIVLLKRS